MAEILQDCAQFNVYQCKIFETSSWYIESQDKTSIKTC